MKTGAPSANYQDDLMRSLRHVWQILRQLLYPTYGRIVRIMTAEGHTRTVTITAPRNEDRA